MPSIANQNTRPKPCRTILCLVLLATPSTLSIAEDYYPASNIPTEAPSADSPAYQPGAIRQATHQEPLPASFPASSADKALLLPPRPGDSSFEKSAGGSRTFGAIVSVTASLTVVVGLFMVIAWLMRRNMPQSSRRLPSEVIETLGRAPLSGRQQMHLLRFGNKLLLVCVSPTGVNTLAEITDPSEIDRLASLCGSRGDFSNAATGLKQILGQFTGDKGRSARSSDGIRTTSSSAIRVSAVAAEAADV
jgi:flagellar biogenesis protein FliO